MERTRKYMTPAAAALLIAAGSTAAVAESHMANTDSDVSTGMSTGTEMQNNMGNASMDGMGKANLNYGQVISDIRSGKVTSTDFSTLSDDASIETVLLSELEGDADATALDNAISAEGDAMVAFHDQIAADAQLAAALTEEGYMPEDVVAANVVSENEVVLVINDRDS